MKYYIIAGEASGDLHGSNLMKGIYGKDPDASIRFWGGDLMNQVYASKDKAGNGGGLVRHYKEGAIMGFWEVFTHAGKLLGNIRSCKKDILSWQPDAVILIDYPGFNFKIAGFTHRHGIRVVPAVGPSSLMLALMASGLNGQSFAFCGYLPAKPDARKERLKTIEKISASTGQTQIFIETPYRNDAMFTDILSVCRPQTKICVAADITLPDAFIRTMNVAQWKTSGLTIGKRPCVFVLSAI